MLKKILYIFAGLIFALLICIFIIFMISESIVKKGIENYGPEITGTDIKLGSFGFSILNGQAEIENFAIANPKDYSKGNAFEVKRLFIDIDFRTLFSDKIVVQEILIDGMAVNFEPRPDGSSNLSRIRKNIEAFSGGLPKAKEPSEEPEMIPEKKENANIKTEPGKAPEEPEVVQDKGKKIHINILRIKNTKLSVAATFLEQKSSATLQLPDMELKNIGGDDGEYIDDIAPQIFDFIYTAVIKAVKESPGTILKNIKDNIKLEGKPRDIINSLKKLF